ncbi:MAG TPA: hypothetical protein VE242_01160, partial [Chthoniobacterales bacterium]|nr:hypothetical protein [Chthoniobacterales bacterium]
GQLNGVQIPVLMFRKIICPEEASNALQPNRLLKIRFSPRGLAKLGFSPFGVSQSRTTDYRLLITDY